MLSPHTLQSYSSARINCAGNHCQAWILSPSWKKKERRGRGGTERGDTLFISHATNSLSHLSGFPFESELGINLRDLERRTHTISSDEACFSIFPVFSVSLWPFLSATHTLTVPKNCLHSPLFSRGLFCAPAKSNGDSPHSSSDCISVVKKGFFFSNGLENYKGLSVRHICLPNVISG